MPPSIIAPSVRSSTSRQPRRGPNSGLWPRSPRAPYKGRHTPPTVLFNHSALLRHHQNIEGRSTMPLPSRQGLYDPAFEHDACGLGFVATLSGKPTHQIVKQGLEILE